jgi:pyruvate formate lyase activating enzyme
MNIPKIKGFLPLSMLDWPGKVSSVIFLGGCAFRCPFCHNHELALSPEKFPDQPLDYVIGFLKERAKWIDGITVTGGEPTCHEGLPRLLERFKDLRLSVKLDTNGSNPGMLERLLQEDLISAVSMDIKAPLDPLLYSKLAGVSVNMGSINKSIEILKKSDIVVFFRTTVIPGLIGEQELQLIKDQLGDIPCYSIQRFRNKDTLDPEFKKIPDLDLGVFDYLQLKFAQTDLHPAPYCMN